MTAPGSPATAGLVTAGLSLQVGAAPHLSLSLVSRHGGDQLLKSARAQGFPVELVLPDRRLVGDDFVVATLFAGHDAVIATCTAGDVELRLTWTRAPAEALRLLIQARVVAGDAPRDGALLLTLLDHLHPGDLAHVPHHDGGRGPLAADGRPLVRAGHHPLPATRWCPTGGVAVLARYAPHTQAEQRWQPVPTRLAVRLRQEWLDACELTIAACAPGWPGAFAVLHDQVRAGLDLTEYRRPDLAWYRDQWLQHFTFLYGREIFDHARGRLDVDRLLDDGLRFGGYDGLLLWPAYPRLGVDERSQWDVYDDVPGGRPALRALADRARARGARVFIPYLPWDAPPDARHGTPAPAPAELARAVDAIGADGVFLDTLDSITLGFRRAIDRVRPGVVFCAEDQPPLAQLPHITGSWDQADHRHAAEIDLARFLFPEHASFMISRHAVGAHREAVIARALLNGAGLVVWQDVFGEVLPYTDREVALVRAAAAVLRRHAGCFRAPEAFPLIPAAHPEIVANAFGGAGGAGAVVTMYNAGAQAVEGDLLEWRPPSGDRLLWTRVPLNGAAVEAPPPSTPVPRATLAPGELAVFAGAPETGA